MTGLYFVASMILEKLASSPIEISPPHWLGSSPSLVSSSRCQSPRSMRTRRRSTQLRLMLLIRQGVGRGLPLERLGPTATPQAIRYSKNFIEAIFFAAFLIYGLVIVFSFVVVQRKFGTDEVVCPGRELEGIYTQEIYRFRSKVPWLVQKMLPEEAFELHEESWNAYPYFKTVITDPGYMKKSFRLEIESMHHQDAGDTNNALNTKHKKREVIELNIYDDQRPKSSEINEKNDPRQVRSEKMEIGPLEEDWMDAEEVSVVCAYKLVSVTFN
ncbi:unnamed protein product, partial [Mesorhabditis spiculigera]